jgi:hypothetical protein
MSHLTQWLAEAQADATETKLQHERMARALGGIASFSCSCDGCRYIVGIAKRALTGVESYPPKPLDPVTGALE